MRFSLIVILILLNELQELRNLWKTILRRRKVCTSIRDWLEPGKKRIYSMIILVS